VDLGRQVALPHSPRSDRAGANLPAGLGGHRAEDHFPGGAGPLEHDMVGLNLDDARGSFAEAVTAHAGTSVSPAERSKASTSSCASSNVTTP
jgi:hypothetical protein